VTPAAVVSINVNPVTATVPLGINPGFTAQGIFTDGSAQDLTSSAHWSSAAPGVATVSNSSGSGGLTTTLGGGSTTIAATLGSVAGTANLAVTTAILAAIQISPQSPSVAFGVSEQFSATGIYSDGTTADISASVTWISSSPAVATMSNSSLGLAVSADAG
jgi:hypothetical protein